ncbi:MAG: class I SAM-dependent methyltransferase [Bacteroidia bacterium]|nr:class I SAM-dependent methyltransferase [Bacteroidia bacterium]
MDLKEALLPGSDVVRHPWELARLKVADDLMRKYLRLDGNKSLTILDMGCGDLWFVEQLAKSYPNHSYLGVDIAFTDQHLETLSTRLKDEPIQLYRSLDDASEVLKDTKVDIVLLLDVIEHIEDEISFLKWMQTFPQIGKFTNFLITVPAFQSLFCEHDVFLEHYRRYTNPSLHKALDKANMEVKRKGYFFSSLLLPRMLQVMKEKVSGKDPNLEKGVGQWEGSDWQTKMMTQILWNDYKTAQSLRKIGIKTPGLSNYAIANPYDRT